MSGKKIRFGVSGLGGRGQGWVGDLMKDENIDVVAACDISRGPTEWAKLTYPDLTYYSSLEAMLEHDIDAVFVATPAFVHAREAIKSLKAGKHVISEVTACWTMAEAVELYETAKTSGRVYMFAENYCYFFFIQQMKRLYDQGAIGELLFSDVHYLAVYKGMWIPYCRYFAEWRSWMPQSYYSSHALGPALYVTGLRPVEVTGFEVANREVSRCIGKRTDEVANFVVKLNSGALVTITSSFMAPRANHLWYHFSGDKGEMENDRYGDFNGFSLATEEGIKHSIAESPHSKDIAAERGHGGGDYFIIYDFIRAVRGEAPVPIDARLGLEMSMPGILAHRSALQGGVKLEVPDLDDPRMRDQYREDTATPFTIDNQPGPVPPSIAGTPDLDPSVCLMDDMYSVESIEARFGVFHTKVS